MRKKKQKKNNENVWSFDDVIVDDEADGDRMQKSICDDEVGKSVR